HFEARTAGHQRHAGAGRLAQAGERAHEFVQRVVAADVFAHQAHLALRVGPAGSVRGARQVVQRLARPQGAHGAQHRGKRHGPGAGGHARQLPQHFAQGFHAAQAAAGAAGHGPAAHLQARLAGAGNLDLHHDAVELRGDLDAADVAGLADDALGQRKAQREVFQIAGRGQHGGVADAAVFERDGRFLGHLVPLRGGVRGAAAHAHHGGVGAARARHGGRSLAVHGHVYLPPSTASAPRFRSRSSFCCTSVNRDHWRCHSDGWDTRITCTAVTLYSGQFVAQSELSVVTTLAPDSGKWNVVYTTPGCTRSVSVARSTVSPARLCTPTQSPSAMPRSSASCGWSSSTSSLCHTTLGVRRVCAPTLYCDSIRPVVSSSGYLRVLRSSEGTYLVMKNLPLPRTNSSICMMGVPSGAWALHGHCRLPMRSSLSYDTPANVGVRRAISSMISAGWR